MKILHILDHSLPLQSGYVFRTMGILNAQRELGWQTAQLTTPKHKAAVAPEEDVDGWHFYRTLTADGAISSRPVWGEIQTIQATARRLRAVIDQVKPDLLHAHSPVLNAIPALSVGRSLGIPVVYEIRAFWEDAAVNHGTTSRFGPRYFLTRWTETWAIRKASAVTTICNGLRRDIVGRGIPESKVFVIPNAVNTGAFVQNGTADAALAERHGLRDQGPIVGFIGSFYAYEGLDLLLAAIPRMRAALPTLKVVLVGGGPEEERLKAQCRDLGVDDAVVWVGRVPQQDVVRYYDLMDAMVYPRHRMRLTDIVTPLKPLEAMAKGRIVVASDVGGHKELIDDGRTGFLFEAGSAEALAGCLTRVLQDRPAWPAVIAAARKYVDEERTWTASASIYKDVYSFALGKPRER